jgi:hypothetical protein
MAEAMGAPDRTVPGAGGSRLEAPRTAPHRAAWPVPLAAALGGRLLTLAAGAAAAAPIAASTARAVRAGWEPTDDKAIIATRAYDVFTRHPPLVGQFSMVGRVTGHAAHDLGPTLYWLLAVPVRLGAPSVMAATMGLVNAAAVVAVVALARSGGGRPLMFLTAAAIPLMCMSLAAETFHDIWNPAASLFPFLLLIFLCWSLARGRYRLLPVTVLVASFVVQAHLTYLAPTVGMLAIGLVGLMLMWRTEARPTPGRRGAAVVVVAALLVGGACWAPAVVDEAEGHPGNLTSVVQDATAHKPTLGAGVGFHAVVHAIGVRPWWLTVPRTRWDRKVDVRATPSTARRLTAIGLVAGLAVVAAAGALWGRIDVAAAAMIGIVLCVGLGVVAAETPTLPVLAATLGYTLWWGSQVGMWVWLVVAWSGWLLLASAVRALARRRRKAPGGPAGAIARSASAVASVAGLVAAAIAGTTVAATEVPDQHAPLYRPIAAIGARLDAAIPVDRTVRLDGKLDVATQPFKAAVRFQLARRGIRVLSKGAGARNGAWYELDHHPYGTVLTLTDHPRHPHRAALLVHVRFTEHAASSSVFVWVARSGAGVRGRSAWASGARPPPRRHEPTTARPGRSAQPASALAVAPIATGGNRIAACRDPDPYVPRGVGRPAGRGGAATVGVAAPVRRRDGGA